MCRIWAIAAADASSCRLGIERIYASIRRPEGESKSALRLDLSTCQPGDSAIPRTLENPSAMIPKSPNDRETPPVAGDGRGRFRLTFA
jgi:hypothetical protein